MVSLKRFVFDDGRFRWQGMAFTQCLYFTELRSMLRRELLRAVDSSYVMFNAARESYRR